MEASCQMYLRKKKKGCKGFRRYAFTYRGHPLAGRLAIAMTLATYRDKDF